MHAVKRLNAAAQAVLYVAMVVMLAPSSASAALAAADLDPTLTAIQADATTAFTTVLPYMLAILGLVIAFKLIKRFVGKV